MEHETQIQNYPERMTNSIGKIDILKTKKKKLGWFSESCRTFINPT